MRSPLLPKGAPPKFHENPNELFYFYFLDQFSVRTVVNKKKHRFSAVFELVKTNCKRAEWALSHEKRFFRWSSRAKNLVVKSKERHVEGRHIACRVPTRVGKWVPRVWGYPWWQFGLPWRPYPRESRNTYHLLVQMI